MSADSVSIFVRISPTLCGRQSRAADRARHQAYDYLHAAARAVGFDSEGFGPHTFRRANISWRQQVGGSAAQAGNIAGRAEVQVTAEYTHVA
jgi:hypothetical protein